MSSPGPDSDLPVRPLAWAWWLTTGASLGVGVVGILTVGVAFLALGIALALGGAVMARTRNRAAYAAVAGAAAAPVLLAWLNRSGPGTVCRSGAGDTTCVEQWSPWPFLGVAVVLVLIGTHLARRSRSPR